MNESRSNCASDFSAGAPPLAIDPGVGAFLLGITGGSCQVLRPRNGRDEPAVLACSWSRGWALRLGGLITEFVGSVNLSYQEMAAT